MKIRYLLALSLLLFSTSFKVQPTENIWIGTIEVHFDPETSEFILTYTEDYNKCFTKYIIDHIYERCDSVINKEALDERFQWSDPPIDTIKPKIPIKTIKM